MKLLYDYKTHRGFSVLIRTIPKEVRRIYAAIAFNSSDLLINKCISDNIHLEWWGLFNADFPTSLDLVKTAISEANIKFYPFPELFHPKVIYFEGFGLYIGSANMTNNALHNNVEAGVFLEETELNEYHKEQTIEFFNFLRGTSIPATIDDVANIENFLKLTVLENEKIEALKSHVQENFEECFGHLFNLKPGVTDFGSASTDKKNNRKLYFLQEWREAQKYLQIVDDLILKKCHQPKWIGKNGHPTIITDQLLHAYYYSYVLKEMDEGKSIEKVNESYEKNKGNPTEAVLEAIRWWESLKTAPSSEDVHINQWGPSNKSILEKVRSGNLKFDDFLLILKQNHAAGTHARQITNKFFGLPEDFQTDREGRIEIYAKWLFNQKSKQGLNIHDVIRYILFEDSILLEERIYNAIYDEKYRIEHFGKSIIGELVGWGRPDKTHLRNNRVNKALRCLGYDVRLFSE
jgi:hypothetical protein